ncbi:protein Teyrha-meyrha isoform X2 [Contarinia nasturtii]|nr:protein Teyrha-meyrha isoform X2 [Contarinia nasturtii]
MAMEGSEYGSAHLPSPALVVFSQAANGLSEALRIQRPFHSQIQDAKDLHHLSLVGSYGAHLLHGFPPHFLHPTVTSASSVSNPFSSSGGAFVKPFPSNLPLPSAFAPPTKCVGLGLEQGILFSGSESFRTDSSSPACTSLSPPVKEESLEAQTSEEGDRDRICSPERSPEAPGFRPPKTNGAEPINLHMDTSGHSLYRFPFYNSFKNFHQHQSAIKKVTNIGTPPSNSCPVCGVHLLANELETHFLAELDRLYKLSSGPERQRIRASFNMNNTMHMSNGLIQGPDSRWETFQRIRTNRQGRLRAKTRKRKGDSESEYPEHIRNSQCQSCPVCHGRLQRTPEEIAQHVEDCLRKSGQSRSEEEDETVDVESYGDETASSAMNLAAAQNNNNNNNNITKMDSIRSTMRSMPFTSSGGGMPSEEHMITSRNSIWQQHTKHRMGPSPPSMGAPNLVNSMPAIGCGPPPTMFPVSESGAPTSSDQINEYVDRTSESPNARMSTQDRNRITVIGGGDMSKGSGRDLKNGGAETTHNTCDNDNDEEVIVTNDEDECPKKMQPSTKDLKRNDKNSAEEAVSSMEIDSSANDLSNHKALITSPDSYVSTTNEPTEPASRAQVLEELRARIRELEGSPLKLRGHEEEHYKCYI